MSSPCRARVVPESSAVRLRTPAVVILCLLVSTTALAQFDENPPKFDSYSDFGGVGLLQMPTARFSPEGEFAFATTKVYPYTRNALTAQPLPWLEGVLRYTTVENRLYGPESFSGDQSYKDKGIDIKLRLVEESSAFPQVVVGLRDIGGTGLFAGEYVALSRRYYDFDFTLGMGWGYTGTRGQLPNPLGFLFSSFKQRASVVGQGGNLSTTAYFHGERVSIFGGVTYQTPIPGLILKAELDGNNYQSEPFSNTQRVTSPINIGATYSYGGWLDLSLGLERGNTFMAQLALHGNVHNIKGFPKYDAPPVALKPRDLSADVAAMAQRQTVAPTGDPQLRLSQALSANRFKVESVEINGHHATATVSQRTFRNKAKALGRAARIMANELPPEVEELTYVNVERGIETQRVSLMRKDLEKAVNLVGSPEEMAINLRIEAPGSDLGEKPVVDAGRYPSLEWGWNPQMKHQIGGPDAAYFYQIYLKADAEIQFTRKLSTTAEIGFNLADNLDGLKLNSDSVLPHVRSDIKEYLKQGKNGITRLQADYLTNIGSSFYGRLSAGLFEEMFGGVGGELLYKPFGKRWAMGVELNRVQQRDYDMLFSFLDYGVTTGHVDFYYRLPFYNMTAQLSVGQYLAGDQGATIGVARQFDSGAVIGAFATKTNVSAEDFGEGSFDKGIYISIPMDMISLYSSRSSLGMGWRPLTRDGGQRLSIGKRLYPIVADSNPDKFMRDWGEVLE